MKLRRMGAWIGIGWVIAGTGLGATAARADIGPEYAPDEMVGVPLESGEPAARTEEDEHDFAPAPETARARRAGTEQAVGFYSDGTLTHPSELASQGYGFLKLFLPRDRAYGSEELLNLIRFAASGMRLSHPRGERLQVGDISQREGGRISGHASHQNGLDADIVYYRLDHREQDPQHVNGFEESFVLNNERLSPNFDLARNWRVIQTLVGSGQVNRIFVDPVIKRELCRYAREKGQYSEASEPLRRLRPYEGHQDHFHLRIQCPASSPRCKAQEPPPEGNGCSEVGFRATD